MKTNNTNTPQPRHNKGSALVITMSMLAVALLGLASYLTMVQFQAASVARSQSWNSAIAVSEAGVEEALAMVNSGAPSVLSSPGEWTNNLAACGWLPFTNGTSMTRYVSGSNCYTVNVTISNGSPVITSTASISYETYPWVFSAARSPFYLAAIGFNNGSAQITMTRTVQVQTASAPLFSLGLMARTNVTFSGNVLLDSFDSSNPLYSTNGQYTPSKARANCGVGSDSDVVNAITGSGSVDVYGTLHTGPTGGYSLNGGASVGDANWVNGGNNGVESGHFYNDMNVSFPNVPPPPLSGIPPVGGTVNGTDYAYVLNSSGTLYQLPSLSLSAHQQILVSGTNVTLYVTGDVSLTGQSAIIINPNASLVMYVGGASTSFSGQGIVNAGNALQFQYYGLPSNTSVDYSGGSSFVGVLYAPQASYTMSGNSDYFGAAVAYSITKTGTSNFHYDENLKNNGPSSGYFPTSWTEVTN